MTDLCARGEWYDPEWCDMPWVICPKCAHRWRTGHDRPEVGHEETCPACDTQVEAIDEECVLRLRWSIR